MNKIMKAMKISGVIGLLCLVLSIAFQSYVYNNYRDVITETNTAIEAVRQIVTYSYQYQLTVYKNTHDAQDFVDYKTIYNNYSEGLKRMMDAIDDNRAIAQVDPAGTARLALRADIEMLMIEGAKKEPPEVDEIISSIASRASIITAYLELNREYKQKELIRFEIISYSLSFILFVICLASVFLSQKYAKAMEEEYEKQVEKENYTDGLTGLLNQKYVTHVLPGLVEANGKGYLYMFDMDNFKKLNDTCGHDAGDKALKSFAKVLMSNVREGDMACRMGGDEFLLYVNDMTEDREARTLAKRIQEGTAKRFYGTNLDMVAISCGIAPVTKGRAFARIRNDADQALYYVKENRKGTYHMAKRRKNRQRRQSEQNS